MQLLIAAGNQDDINTYGNLPGTFDVGGISLSQRALRSAHLAGITHAIVMAPRDHKIVHALQHDRILKDMHLSFVHDAPALDQISTQQLAELPGLQEEFIFAPGDRVLTPAILKDLLKSPNTTAMFDADNTLIAAKLTPGHIEELDLCADATTIAHNLHITRSTTKAPALLSVRTQEDAATAKEALFKTLRKPLTRNGDGLTAYLINRPISLTVSRQLIKLPVTPNHVTFLNLLLGIYAGYMLASGNFMGIAIGAFLMQLVSIFDGIDGELARMKLLQSPLGAWFDVVGDDVVRVATIAGLGISCYKLNPDPIYLWAMAAGTFGILSTVFTLYRDLKDDNNASLNSVKWFFEEEGRKPSLWQNFLIILSLILKRDTYTLILMAIAAMGYPQVALFAMIVGICIITTTHFIQKLIGILKGDQADVALSAQEAKEMSRA